MPLLFVSRKSNQAGFHPGSDERLFCKLKEVESHDQLHRRQCISNSKSRRFLVSGLINPTSSLEWILIYADSDIVLKSLLVSFQPPDPSEINFAQSSRNYS